MALSFASYGHNPLHFPQLRVKVTCIYDDECLECRGRLWDKFRYHNGGITVESLKDRSHLIDKNNK